MTKSQNTGRYNAFYAKCYKVLLLMVRKISRPMVKRLRMASAVYYWSDIQLFALMHVRVLPVVFYRFLKLVCNLVASANTVGYSTLRSNKLQRAVDWLIHRIPDEIRFA